MKFLFIGDSNLRNCSNVIMANPGLAEIDIALDFRGGRCSYHLFSREILAAAGDADRVIVHVGNNDIGSGAEDEDVIENYKKFGSRVGLQKFRVVGLMPRRDHCKARVAIFNQKLKDHFPVAYLPCRFLRQDDFKVDDPAHLNVQKNGAMNYSRLIHFLVTTLQK